jgi:pantoate--beta-alanine ligase
MPKLFSSLQDWSTERAALTQQGRSVGFVPTMGALHAGHRALLERARAENDYVVLSIFVNPTQFDDPSDLQRYPRTLDADLALAGDLADGVLLPTPESLYPDEYRFRLTEYNLSARWEGAHRQGHFEGVLTVVLKLLNLVQPKRAYFGEKDWQQLRLITDMVRALLLPVEIVACPTVRDPDGLALSSRNRRLSPGGRAAAAAFPRILRESPDALAARERLAAAGFAVDYVDDFEGVRLGAIRLEGIRLIDNVRVASAANGQH